MDHRVGTILSAAAVIGGITMGGYALWTARSGDQPPQFSVTRSAGQGFEQDSDHGGGLSFGQGSDQDGGPRGGRDGTPKGRSGAGDDPDDDSGMSGSMSMPGQGPASSADAGIMVDVEGKVARPGVQRLPAGARVLDALTLAGGALPGTDLSNLDQARVLTDGEQIVVGPGAGAEALAPEAKGRTKALPSTPIRLNTATLEQFEQLPGVGPALAQRVLDWRTEHGRFASVEDLQQVKGFGPHKFGAVRALVTL
jgi:competence protein ComEA